jgi:hypothetical protein
VADCNCYMMSDQTIHVGSVCAFMKENQLFFVPLKYSKPMLIQINWRKRSSGLMKQKIALKDKKNLENK